jgi:target of rapamycin complex 2 subunit MAPKAP1
VTGPRPPLSQHASAASSVMADFADTPNLGGRSMTSPMLSRMVLLTVEISAPDVHFTTKLSVYARWILTHNRPSDMYIADLTETLCNKKQLPNPSEWVLCLRDLSIALPLDRTVAGLEGQTQLALVKKQWAMERGLNVGAMRGGDPSCMSRLYAENSFNIQEEFC